MNRKQFIVVLAVLIALVAGGLGVARWKQQSYAVADKRVGEKLVEALKVDDVGSITITDAQGTVTLVRGEGGYGVKERGGFPADFDQIRDLLVKLAELKVVQAEALTNELKPRLQLASVGSGAKPDETGLTIELKSRDGRLLAQIVLGKKAFKPSQVAGLSGDGIASGRYVWVGADPEHVSIVNEPFANVSAKPQQWLARELARVERLKSIAAYSPDGKERWLLHKDAEAGEWKFAGPGKLDLGKATDASSALYALQIADVANDVSDAAAGLDKPTTIRAKTFEDWSYELKIGKPAPENRYYLKVAVAANLPEARTPVAGEKPEEKEKADKAFAERKEVLATKLAQEKAVSDRTVIVAKSSIEALLRDRSAFLAVAKPKADAKKK